MKVKLFSNYASSEELLNRFNNNYGISDNDIEFTIDDDYDTAVVFNRTFEKIKEGTKIITIIQEPSWSPVHIGNDFLVKSDILVVHDFSLFEQTYNSRIKKPIEFRKLTDCKIVEAPSYMWYHDHVSRDFFDNTDKVKKKKKLSMIVSNLYLSVGNYRKRIELVEKILKSDLDCDIFGRGLNIDDPRYKGELEYKFSGLLPYEYSIAIENSCENNYVTEKFIDPILCHTVPIYCGAPNIADIYSEEVFRAINLDSETIIEDIKSIITKTPGTQSTVELNDAKKVYFFEHNLYKLIKSLC